MYRVRWVAAEKRANIREKQIDDEWPKKLSQEHFVYLVSLPYVEEQFRILFRSEITVMSEMEITVQIRIHEYRNGKNVPECPVCPSVRQYRIVQKLMFALVESCLQESQQEYEQHGESRMGRIRYADNGTYRESEETERIRIADKIALFVVVFDIFAILGGLHTGLV